MRNDIKDISVARPDMAVVGQDRLGLSPFGMLSRVFNQEILQRSRLMAGAYREVPLTLLEEEDGENVPAASKPPELRLDVAVNVTVETPEEKKGDAAGQRTLPPAEKRILERVRVLERELRQSRETTRRVILQSGPRRQELRLPAEQPGAADGAAGGASPIRESLRLTDSAGRTGGPGTGHSRIGALRPMTRARELPLASAATAAPAGGGWTPKQQPLHPGYPTAREEPPAGGTAAGSILLPDALRRRRQEISERQSRSPRLYEELRPALEWAVQGTEAGGSDASARMARMAEEAVRRTLERSRTPQAGTTETETDRLTRDPATVAASGKPAVPARSRRDGTARTAEDDSPRRGPETAGGRPAPEAGPASELPAGENKAPRTPQTVRQASPAAAGPAAESGTPAGVPSAEAPWTAPASESGDSFPETLEQRTGIPPESGRAERPWTPPELTHRQQEADSAPASGAQDAGQTGSQTRRPRSAQKETEAAPAAERGTREAPLPAHWEHDPGSAGTPSAAAFEAGRAEDGTGGGPRADGEARTAGEERAQEPVSLPAGKGDLKDGSALAAIPPDRREETRQEVPLTYRQTPEAVRTEAERAAGPEPAGAEAPSAALTKGAPAAGRKARISDAEKAASPDGLPPGQGRSAEADGESARPLLGKTPGRQPWTPVPLELSPRDGQPAGAEPAPRTLGRGKAAAQQATRDIRVTAPGRGRSSPVPDRPAGTPAGPSAAAFERTEQSAGPEKGAGPSAALPRSGRMWTEAPELTFARPPWERQEADRQSETPPEAPGSDYLNSLPQWARELLEKSGAPASGAGPVTWQAPREGGRGPAAGAPHGGPAQQAGAGPGGTIRWTAPGAQTAAPDVTTRPASIQYREKTEPEGQPATQRYPALSEAEVQKTADKVYRIIEERLRRELRRSGK